MLLIYTRTSNSVPLKILSIEDGTVLMSFDHPLHQNKKVDFIEQFNEKLIVKQEGENLQILDVYMHFLMYICILLSHKYLMQSNQNTFFFVWVLTHAPNVGKELLINRSEQDRVYEFICLYFSV
jgi:hypothetical protein